MLTAAIAVGAYLLKIFEVQLSKVVGTRGKQGLAEFAEASSG